MVKKNMLGGDMIKNHRGANAEYGTQEKKAKLCSTLLRFSASFSCMKKKQNTHGTLIFFHDHDYSRCARKSCSGALAFDCLHC